MLSVNNVTKKYGTFTALENIDLEFNNGIYALIAPNGAGKTTLIKMIATLIFPSQGEILYDGTEITSLDDEYRNLIGYLPQDFGYYKNYSPKKFLLYLAALKGMAEKDAVKRIKKLLKMTGLEESADKRMSKLSGGMIQRVGIAEALLNDPKILLLDEPTAGLDPKERARFRNIISELSRDKIVIMSTHIVSDIEFIANEVIMIKNHKLLYKDTVKNICNTINGRVYEAEMDYDKARDFAKNHVMLSERQEKGKMMIRFVGDDVKDSSWKEAVPDLEDVFLYEYR